MSTIHQSRRRSFGIIAVLALTLLAPLAVTAEEEVAVLVPVAAPAVVGNGAENVRATRTLAAERALQGGDLGSMRTAALGGTFLWGGGTATRRTRARCRFARALRV